MEDKIYSVAVSCRGVNGWVEYDTEAKTVKVFLDDEKAVADAEKFLSEKHVIKVPHESLLDFTEETFDPLADVKSFQTVLTRLWENTEVHVDWSRPVEYVKAHPNLD
ncbi:MAG: hypothetical protein J6N55_06805 [Anaerovibrio sp.]|uniref:hypothetical protein n=1 Tax=Anaerovibrio sp. TaxID=1872532 RepID=UPI001B26691F|nr:hypothetical protein [Anaerovibrio sp.]MBO5588154.1 hypothetical protein [Anaerovibrio sp.]MBO6245972.1 hypothetical protein [Anaerovibrio sp.]